MTRRTKKLYNRFAEIYHKHISRPENIYHQLLDKPSMISLLKGIVKNKKVLDIGCGSGRLTKMIRLLGADVAGLDFSKSLIEIARRENPTIKFYVRDSRKTRLKKSQFDVVTSSLMMHCLKKIEPLFKEVNRVLKKEGYFVFSTHHPFEEITKEVKVNEKESYLAMPYFNNDKYAFTLAKKLNLIAYHRTFENIFRSLKKSGFIVEDLLEPKPPKKAQKIDRGVYKKTSHKPSILVIRARKV